MLRQYNLCNHTQLTQLNATPATKRNKQLKQLNVTNTSQGNGWCVPMSLDVLVAVAAGGWQPVFSLHSSHKTFKSLKFNFPPPQHRINHLQILIFF